MEESLPNTTNQLKIEIGTGKTKSIPIAILEQNNNQDISDHIAWMP